MIVLAIDPGPLRSALVRWDPEQQTVSGYYLDNAEAQERLRLHREAYDGNLLIIEQVVSYGRIASQDLLETVFWSGRFAETWGRTGGVWTRISEPQARTHLCGSRKAEEKLIRQALIDRFGGQEQAIGRVGCPTCKKRGDVPGTVVCPECDGAGRVAGTRGMKLCRKCSGRKSITARVTCGDCAGSGWAHPPGPLAAISGHCWSALAVAVAGYETLERSE